MPKHIIDHHPVKKSSHSLTRFTRLRRKKAEEGSNPSAKAVHRRSTLQTRQRVKQFLRVDRGQEA